MPAGSSGGKAGEMLVKRKRNALRSGRVWEQGSFPPASANPCAAILGGRVSVWGFPGPAPSGKGTGLGFCDPWRDPGSRFQGR